MIFHPQSLVKKEGSFLFSGKVRAIAHPCLQKDIIREFWHNFTCQCAQLSTCACDEYLFCVGEAEKLVPDDDTYTVNVTPRGICICAGNEKDLLRGFMTLLDRIRAVDTKDGLACEVECCQIREQALIAIRMVHFCVFPETELWELQRFLRFCAALKYTHVVLEFWGMLKYDCMAELAWPHAFGKEEIRPLIREAQDLGLEIVPMFNHWGHASAGRIAHGKHVVLDQNPALQTYFSEDGWCWDIRKPKVRQLLREIRAELLTLCGEGSYFHIGCDEAFTFEFTKENVDHICDFINEVADEIAEKGRRAIAWGDMFLYRHPQYNPKNPYTCNAPSPEIEQYMLERLHRSVVMADWQYDAVQAPVETAAVFRRAGFDCMLCPWDRGPEQMRAVIETVKAESLMGVLHTTWHTLSKGMPYVATAARGCFESLENFNRLSARTNTATLLRRVMPSGGEYAKSGWSRIQIHDQW